MKTLMFPGQGSQAKGMGEDLFDKYPDYVEKADKILGYSIKTLCLDDKEGRLNKTEYTQPALYVVNALSYFSYVEQNQAPIDCFIGHSLGEFNALLAAGCFDFEAGLKLVKKRGELMSQSRKGAMAAVLGVDIHKVTEILEAAELTDIDIANYNTPLQIVISGAEDQMTAAEKFFSDADAMFVPLNTSGAFHSRLMVEAQEKFESYLKRFKLSSPTTQVIANSTAQAYSDNVDAIVKTLSGQIKSTVLWSESILSLSQKYPDMTFTEIGHGDVLSKMYDKIVAQHARLKRTLVKETSSSPSVEPDPIERATIKATSGFSSADADAWNQAHPVGTVLLLQAEASEPLTVTTKSPALQLNNRAVVYLNELAGYVALDSLAEPS